MKAFLINPEEQSIEAIVINSHEEIKKLIGFDTIISDALDGGDSLFFDEDCFLRGTNGRFQVDKLIPVSGKGIIVGTLDEGGATLADVVSGIDDLRQRITYL